MQDIYDGGTAARAVVITPSDTLELNPHTRGIYVGTEGDVTLVTTGGDTITFVGVPAGTILPIRAKFVKESTTASDMVGMA